MILRITVGDNDFTEALEEFAKDPAILRFYGSTTIPEYASWEAFKENERFLELLYNIDKYDQATIEELLTAVKKHWELYVKYVMPDHEWWDDEDKERVRNYLIRDFKVKFQKSLTPRWENGEVVYICLGYYNRQWTF